MKKYSGRKLLLNVCTVVIFAAGCATVNNEDAEPQNLSTFVVQDIQPIEENPFMLPTEIPSQAGLHRLDVQRPHMHEMKNSDDVVDAILGSAVQAAVMENQDLLVNLYAEIGGQPATTDLSDKNGYISASFRKKPGEQEELWGDLRVEGLGAYTLSSGEKEINANSAVLIKYRYSADIGGMQVRFYNGSAETNTGIGADNHLWMDSGQAFMRYGADSRGEYTNVLNFIDGEWYYSLAALDENYGYRYIIWQENNPVNHAFYACDLGAVYKPYVFMREQDMRTGLRFWARTNEISVDIESIMVFDFEHFNDMENGNSENDRTTYRYANDQEKYELAVQFFEAEDYFNAYTLFKDLNGFDTGDYLADCERLLKTVEISDATIAGMIRRALKERGIPIYAHLYTYQAEKLESLDLSGSQIDDLGFLANFPNLKEINLTANAIYDLSPLRDLHSLERLSLGKNHISDLRPINGLQNLQYLDLNNNLLEDVSDLHNLTSLNALNLSTNKITSIDGLDGLPNLESVDLSNNFISSVSSLENSPIKALNIMNTDINDLKAVENFPELESLYAGFRYIWKGNDHYLLTERYEFDYHFFDGLSGLEALGGHENLRKLYLARLNVESLEPLTTISNLESLIFHQYSGASHPGVLGKLVNLKELALDSFGIGFYDTSFLSNLTQLEKLSIGTFCSVDDLSVISGLTHLEELRMHQYGDDLSFLSELKNLKLLQLIHWEDVNDYSPLLALDNLEYLDLQEMTVYDLSIISQIENLKYLKMNSAQINNIQGVAQLENLACFIMRWPRIMGEYQTELFDRSLFQGLNNLQYALVDAAAQEGFAYTLGDPEYAEFIEKPPEQGVEIPGYDYYWVGNMEDAGRLDAYVGGQHLVINGLIIDQDQTLRINIPQYIRSLYISSDVDYPVKLALNCVDNAGLERIAIGNTYVSEDYPEGFGQGSFILENLDGMSGCTNLKEFYTDSTQIYDASGLEKCEKLEVVENN